MVPLRGQKKFGHRPDRSPLGVNSKFPTSIPTRFICRVPPPPYLYFARYSYTLFTDIEDDFLSDIGTPDFFFPIAQADITECSTYAVVCRLKSSPIYTITPNGGLFIHPEYPGVSIKVPKKAVPPKAKFPLELKVGTSVN